MISMTAYSKDYDFIDVINAGASDFILKPFSKEELEAKTKRIERVWELKSAAERKSEEYNLYYHPTSQRRFRWLILTPKRKS